MIQRKLYIDRIKPFMHTDMIKVLTGMRRSGKSVMLELIKEELLSQGILESQFISFNFESMSNIDYTNYRSLYIELEKRISQIDGKAYLFFDEIQEVEEFEKCINSLRVDFDCDIYMTGSNAKLLSSELATYLGGRYIEFVIYPFSFKEYMDSLNHVNINEGFQSYLELGGMPFLTHLDSKEASLLYLRDIYHSVILKDIVMRHQIRDVDLLERIITYMISNIGRPFSANSISQYFKSEGRKVSKETILNYMKICVDAYLFFKAPRIDLVGKKILTVNEKYFLVDHGFRETTYGHNTRDIDQLLENIVYIELLRRGYSVHIGKSHSKEIDFIASKNNETLYIQVTYLLASQDTIKREFSPLLSIKDNYPKYVLSLDDINMSQKGIIHMNIKDFLLQ